MPTVVHELARYKGNQADADLLERLQLIAEDDALCTGFGCSVTAAKLTNTDDEHVSPHNGQ